MSGAHASGLCGQRASRLLDPAGGTPAIRTDETSVLRFLRL